MNQRKVFAFIVALIALAALLGSCTKGPATGSCRTAINEKTAMCVDFDMSNPQEDWRMACTKVIKGTWSDARCDTAGALGGCTNTSNRSVVWTFSTGGDYTFDEAKSNCEKQPGSTFILPPGR